MTLYVPWATAIVATAMHLLLHCPIATSGSPEITATVTQLNQIKPPILLRGSQPTTLSSEGITADAQPLIVGQLNLSSRLKHVVMRIQTYDPLLRALVSMQAHGYLDLGLFPLMRGSWVWFPATAWISLLNLINHPTLHGCYFLWIQKGYLFHILTYFGCTHSASCVIHRVRFLTAPCPFP